MSTTVFRGVVRGRTIELDQETGLPEGEPVRVTVVSSNGTKSPTDPEAFEALKQDGGWADDPEGVDRFLEWNRRRHGLPPGDFGMSFLLDTDICSAYLKNDPRVLPKFMLHFGGLHLSAIIVGELFVWAKRRGTRPNENPAFAIC